MSIGWEGGLLLGLLQGIAEWLPVSSEGLVAAGYSLAYGRDLGEGIEYALWLHAGTAPGGLGGAPPRGCGRRQESRCQPVAVNSGNNAPALVHPD